VQVRPGDIVLGGNHGVVVAPRRRLTEVTDLAATITEREDAITAAVMSCETIAPRAPGTAATRSSAGFVRYPRN
jgi:regulator of RNase E activity RraA